MRRPIWSPWPVATHVGWSIVQDTRIVYIEISILRRNIFIIKFDSFVGRSMDKKKGESATTASKVSSGDRVTNAHLKSEVSGHPGVQCYVFVKYIQQYTGYIDSKCGSYSLYQNIGPLGSPKFFLPS
jgi:hypothetical protein